MRYKAWTSRTTAATVFTALAVLSLTACDDDSPTDPGAEGGTMEAVVRDGASGQSIALSEIGAQTENVSGQFEGQAAVQVQVDGTWRDVEGMTSLNADTELRSGESTMGSTTVEARTYDRVRIVVTNANADVDAGSDIGAGPIQVDVSLAIAGGGEVIVEYNQPVTVQANATTRLVLDINSEAWLTSDAVQAGAVTRAAFEGAATVLVQ